MLIKPAAGGRTPNKEIFANLHPLQQKLAEPAPIPLQEHEVPTHDPRESHLQDNEPTYCIMPGNNDEDDEPPYDTLPSTGINVGNTLGGPMLVHDQAHDQAHDQVHDQVQEPPVATDDFHELEGPVEAEQPNPVYGQQNLNSVTKVCALLAAPCFMMFVSYLVAGLAPPCLLISA